MYKVSLFLVCAVVTMVSSELTAEMRENMFKMQNQCMEKTGATEEMVMNSFAGKFTDAPELAQHLVCVGKLGGILDDAGHLHKDVLKAKIMMIFDDEAKVDAALDKCLIEQDTIEATAVNSAKCMFAEFQ